MKGRGQSKEMGHLKTLADEIFEETVEIRREIHRHPEIGRKEFHTAELIREKLRACGVDEIETPCPTATVALIRGTAGPGKCVALRSDIDALPVTEETGLPYASEIPGMMHACGHDMHTAMLLGAAKLLCGMRDKFSGTVKLIFQPSEDTLPGGAKELVEKGVLTNPQVDAIFGMHMMPDESKVGQVMLHAGPLTTSVDLYDVTVKGKGGHGSAPHTTHDPILAACQMVTLLQQIPARYIDPLDTVIFPVCSIHSGDAPNVIPDEAKFSGIARSYEERVRGEVTKQVFDIARGVEAMSHCKVEINHYEGYPACNNDPALIELIRRAIAADCGPEAVLEIDRPFSFSEDFSYYTNLSDVPGAFVMLAAGHEGELVSLHNSKCAMREEAMPFGIAAWVSIALAYLNH